MYLFFNIYKGDIQPFNISIRLRGKDIRKDHPNGSKDGEIFQRMLNKRAQRALGRSPEEKVKGQGKAIYRGPLMLSTKYW